jgi:hypothetical protein
MEDSYASCLASPTDPMPIQIHCRPMESRELWPPLEDVRVWAAAKIRTGQMAPVATGKVENLVALIDEILDTKRRSRVQGREWGEDLASCQFAPNDATTAMTSSPMRK